MKIGLDFDGVVADCGQLKSDGGRMLYGIDIPPEKFKKEIVVGEGHLTAEQYRELQKTIYEARGIGLRMEPVKAMLEFLPRLIEENHDVRVITSRGDIGTEIAKEWSTQQGLELDFISVGQGKSKLEAARGLDLYIDDDFDKIELMAGEVGKLCLFSWGYNEHIDTGPDMLRVSSWQEIYSTVQEMVQAQ